MDTYRSLPYEVDGFIIDGGVLLGDVRVASMVSRSNSRV
jgi:hypothetical protein